MRHSMFGAAKAYSRARVSYRFAGRVHVVCGAAFLTRVLCGASGGAPSIKVVLVVWVWSGGLEREAPHTYPGSTSHNFFFYSSTYSCTDSDKTQRGHNMPHL